MRHLIMVASLSLLVVLPVRSQKNYTLEEFLNASESELKAHKLYLDMLAQQKKLNIPQSQAMLFYPDPIKNQKVLSGRLTMWLTDWEKYEDDLLTKGQGTTGTLSQRLAKTLNNAMKTENKANAQGHIVLYHSTQPNLYAQSYINTRLKELDSELKGKPVSTETLLMRDLNKSLSYEEEKSKRKKFIKHGAPIHDTTPENQKYLISTNPAITSNIYRLGESSLNYFLQRKNIIPPKNLPLFTPKDNMLLNKILKTQNEELSELLREFDKNTDTGILLQFIVKDDQLARKILYNSIPGGKQNLLENSISDPATILKTIRTNPAAFKNERRSPASMEAQQMRLVISGDKLLDLENPAVKEFDVKAYSGSDQSLKEFQKKVDDTIQKIRSNYLAQKQQLSWPQRIKYGASDWLHKRQSPWEQRQQYKRRLRDDIGSPFE